MNLVFVGVSCVCVFSYIRVGLNVYKISKCKVCFGGLIGAV